MNFYLVIFAIVAVTFACCLTMVLSAARIGQQLKANGFYIFRPSPDATGLEPRWSFVDLLPTHRALFPKSQLRKSLIGSACAMISILLLAFVAASLLGAPYSSTHVATTTTQR
jgi:hypothetical protein